MADIEKVRAAWIVNCDDASKIRNDLINTRPKASEKPSKQHRVLARLYFSLVSHMMAEHVRVHAQFEEYLEPYPYNHYLTISEILEELGHGIVSPIIEASRSGGRPTRKLERVDIAKAIFFLEAVENGDWTCSNPTATVAQNYGVTQAAVRGWIKNADKLTHGVPKPHPNLVEEAMQHAGQRYSIYGRGAPDPESQGSRNR